MTICAPATQTRCIPSCTSNLNIGTLEGLDTAPVNVYIKNLTTGRLTLINLEVSVDGEVIIEDLAEYGFSENHVHQLWITEQNENIDEKLTFTVSDDGGSGTETQLAQLCFIDSAPMIDTQTLKVA